MRKGRKDIYFLRYLYTVLQKGSLATDTEILQHIYNAVLHGLLASEWDLTNAWLITGKSLKTPERQSGYKRLHCYTVQVVTQSIDKEQ